jgi:hypothetical protein
VVSNVVRGESGSEPAPDDGGDRVLIDCDSCQVRGAACTDCVVTVLLHRPPSGVLLDSAEQEAIGALADSGLVPPLRLVPRVGPGEVPPSMTG